MFDQFTTDLPSSLSDRVCRLGIVPGENNFVLAHARGMFSWFSLSLMVTMLLVAQMWTRIIPAMDNNENPHSDKAVKFIP